MLADFGSLLLLILFAISVTATYLAVRRGWMRTAPASVIGGVINIVLISIYAASQGNPIPQAVTIGVALGLLFTLMSISVGAYFLAHSAERPPINSE